MKIIHINKSHRSKYHDKDIFVDDEDYEALCVLHWFIHKGSRGTLYARTEIESKKHYMHRLLLNPPRSKVVDHKDHNGLNNQKENLRIVSRGQNNRNSRIFPHSSQYKGVVWYKQSKKWRAQISINGRPRGLGYFDEEIEAARAYDNAALLADPEHANINGV